MTGKIGDTVSQTPSSSERIDDVDVSLEMQGSFLEYAYSVIYSRALPDARDGLKPVQRRIIYQMAEMGLRPEKGYVKSARVVGEVMGKLHPHGDSAIYDALVRLAQSFSLRVPFVDGHGNFGSLDDGPAASRYTEAKLRPEAIAMTDSLDEDVVDFVPNYDGQLLQPDVLPAAFPNLLVNGAAGIAVGMATNMAPHNLVEVVEATRHLLAHPDATLDDLMAFIPGPDLPSGGIIVGLEGIRDAYLTGKGAFRTRARSTIEQVSARKTGIVVTELPYLVGPERIIERIKDGVTKKKITGISNVVDLTDRKNGLRLVIEVKTGFSPEAVLDQLYRQTPLEDGFSINNVALVAGKPETLGLVDMLRVYIAHRLQVVTRRSRYRLDRKTERLHLVEGLIRAIVDIDAVIRVIRASDDAASARTELQSTFALSELQADYILELRLRRLTKFSRIELESERDSLITDIEALTTLLSSEDSLRTVVSDELADVASKYGTPRRTTLLDGEDVPVVGAIASLGLEVEDEPCSVVLTATGKLLRTPATSEFSAVAKRVKHDVVRSVVRTTTRGDVGAITSKGRFIRFTPVALPSSDGAIGYATGSKATDYVVGLASGERIVSIVPLSDVPIALGTRRGTVKRVDPSTFPARADFSIINLDDGDDIVGADLAPDGHELVFVTLDTQLLHFPAASVRPQGVGAAGIAGIKLTANDLVVSFASVSADANAHVVTITSAGATLTGADPGRAKVTLLTEYPGKGRATGGVRSHTLLKGEVGLALAFVGPEPRACATDGTARELPTEFGKRDGSGSPLTDVVSFIGTRLR
ncbi:MAG: DNA topoisomerase IV subunit A [Microbacteriaceae bacterium]|nr:DNA topoisomerase IV subunit A [Microbacteriaceae bacterium]